MFWPEHCVLLCYRLYNISVTGGTYKTCSGPSIVSYCVTDCTIFLLQVVLIRHVLTEHCVLLCYRLYNISVTGGTYKTCSDPSIVSYCVTDCTIFLLQVALIRHVLTRALCLIVLPIVQYFCYRWYL